MIKNFDGTEISIKSLEEKNKLNAFIWRQYDQCSEGKFSDYDLRVTLNTVLNYFLEEKISEIDSNLVSVKFTNNPKKINSSELERKYKLVDNSLGKDLREQYCPAWVDVECVAFSAKVAIPDYSQWEELLRITANSYYSKILEMLDTSEIYKDGVTAGKSYIRIGNDTAFHITKHTDRGIIVEFSKELSIYTGGKN